MVVVAQLQMVAPGPVVSFVEDQWQPSSQGEFDCQDCEPQNQEGAVECRVPVAWEVHVRRVTML